jgi:hypothetical protein
MVVSIEGRAPEVCQCFLLKKIAIFRDGSSGAAVREWRRALQIFRARALVGGAKTSYNTF